MLLFCADFTVKMCDGCARGGGGGGRENVQAESEPEMRRKEEGFAASEVQPSDLLLSCGPLCSAT